MVEFRIVSDLLFVQCPTWFSSTRSCCCTNGAWIVTRPDLVTLCTFCVLQILTVTAVVGVLNTYKHTYLALCLCLVYVALICRGEFTIYLEVEHRSCSVIVGLRQPILVAVWAYLG